MFILLSSKKQRNIAKRGEDFNKKIKFLQRKQCGGVSGGDIRNGINSNALAGGEKFRNQWNVRAIIASASVWGGGQVGRVGFQNYPVKGYVHHSVGYGCLLEGEHPSYAHIPITVFFKSPEGLDAAAEGVEHTFESAASVAFQNRKALLRGIPAVDYYRQLLFEGNVQLAAEGFQLGRQAFLAEVQVETGFAYGHYFRVLPDGFVKLVQFFAPVVSEFGGV